MSKQKVESIKKDGEDVVLTIYLDYPILKEYPQMKRVVLRMTTEAYKSYGAKSRRQDRLEFSYKRYTSNLQSHARRHRRI